MPLNTDSNGYTLMFAAIMVVVVAVMLSFFAELFKDQIRENVLLDKMNSILIAVDPEVDKTNAKEKFTAHIKPFIVDGKGAQRAVASEEALDVNLKNELAKDASDRNMPVYEYTDVKGEKKFIIPLFGNGLWDEIGGYLALKPDKNSVAGAVFTHVGETPGLGAEMTKEWFTNNFIGEKLFDGKEFKGIKVLKGKNNPRNKEMHMVDGMSGATITGDGIQAMIDKCAMSYEPFLKKK